MKARKLMSFMLCLALVCSMMPASFLAGAATGYGVYVNGEQFTSENASTGILLNAWLPAYAYYDPAANKVTYDGMCDWNYRDIVMVGNGTTDFELRNTWTNPEENNTYQQSVLCYNLTISGARNVTIAGPSEYHAINESLTIDCTGNVLLTGSEEIVYKDLNIKNAKDVYIKCDKGPVVRGSMTVNCSGDMVIEGSKTKACWGNCKITAKSFTYEPGEVGEYAFGGDVSIGCTEDINISIYTMSSVTGPNKKFTITSARNVNIVNTETKYANWYMFNGPVDITASGRVILDNKFTRVTDQTVTFRQQNGEAFAVRTFDYGGFLRAEEKYAAGAVYSKEDRYAKGVFDTHLEHDWKYRVVDKNCIVAECSCDAEAALIISRISFAEYDGEPHGAFVYYDDVWTMYGLPTPEPVYYKDGVKLDGVPVEPGTYVAKITVGGVTAEFTYDIVIPKATLTFKAELPAGDDGEGTVVNLPDPVVTYKVNDIGRWLFTLPETIPTYTTADGQTGELLYYYAIDDGGYTHYVYPGETYDQFPRNFDLAEQTFEINVKFLRHTAYTVTREYKNVPAADLADSGISLTLSVREETLPGLPDTGKAKFDFKLDIEDAVLTEDADANATIATWSVKGMIPEGAYNVSVDGYKGVPDGYVYNGKSESIDISGNKVHMSATYYKKISAVDVITNAPVLGGETTGNASADDGNGNAFKIQSCIWFYQKNGSPWKSIQQSVFEIHTHYRLETVVISNSFRKDDAGTVKPVWVFTEGTKVTLNGVEAELDGVVDLDAWFKLDSPLDCDTKCAKGIRTSIKFDDLHEYDIVYDETGHWCVCKDPDCGVETDKEPHDFGEWDVVRKATRKAPGLKKRVCAFCGYEETEEFPYVPDTGDGKGLYIWSVSWLVSGAVLLDIRRRKTAVTE